MSTSLKDQLEEWRQLENEAAPLKRRLRTIDDRQTQLETLFATELMDSKRQSVIRHGFTLAWIRARATVAWAQEFLKECGPDKASALKDAAAASPAVKLSITTPALPEE